MILEQYYLGCLAHASYLVADEESGEAAIVDPQRDIDQYIADAERLSCRIRGVFLTHFHADFLAGHLELRERTGATIHLGARAGAEYEFTPVGDGDTVALGDVRLQVRETPGHSPESISIVVYDPQRDSPAPYAVLTGDTLFIGDVGRPDLRAALGFGARELAGMLYDSLHEKLLPLPDETLVYPAHGAGSLCGKNLSTDTVSTIGVQRRYNYALQPMSREQFIELVTADQPEAPPYFEYDASLNAREHATLERALAREMQPLSVQDLLDLEGVGGQVLDVRDPADFEGAHLRRSLNIGLGGSYATWCGTILDREHPIGLIAQPGREREAATRLGRIGFDLVAGYLDGGMQALDPQPELLERTERVTAPVLGEWLRTSTPPTVLDVRTPGEFAQGCVPNAVNSPLTELGTHLRAQARSPQRGSTTVVYCNSGYRSAIAASLLRNAGVHEVSDLVGGVGAWQAWREA